MINYSKLEKITRNVNNIFMIESEMRHERIERTNELLRALGGKINFEYRTFNVLMDGKFYDAESVELVNDEDYEIYFKIRGEEKMIDLEDIEMFTTTTIPDEEDEEYDGIEFLEFLQMYAINKMVENQKAVKEANND